MTENPYKEAFDKVMDAKEAPKRVEMAKDPRYIEGLEIIGKARKETSDAQDVTHNFWDLERALQVANMLNKSCARIECSTTFDNSEEFEDHTGRYHDTYIEMLQESVKEADARVVEACIKVANRKVNLDLAKEREAKAEKVWFKTLAQLRKEGMR